MTSVHNYRSSLVVAQRYAAPTSHCIKWEREVKGSRSLHLCAGLFLLVMASTLPGMAQSPWIREGQPTTMEMSVKTTSKAKGIILLIHGLRGDEDTFSTWYPVIKADQQLKSNNIAYKTLVYPTKLWDRLQAQVPGSRLPSLDDLSQWLLTELETHYPPEDYHAVYLVGHSMGGLLIKSAIREKLLGKKEGVRLRNIKFIYLVATPHEGSEWASKPLLSWLEQVKDMRKDSPTLIKLDKEFCSNVMDTEIKYKAVQLQSRVVMLFGSQDDVVLQPAENSLCHKYFQMVNANHSSIVDLNEDKNRKGKESTVYKILTNAIKDFPPSMNEKQMSNSVMDSQFALTEQNMAYIQTDRDSGDTLEVIFENGGLENEGIVRAKLTILEREPISATEIATPVRWIVGSDRTTIIGKKITVLFDDIKKDEKDINFEIGGPILTPNQSMSYSLDLRWTEKRCIPKTTRCSFIRRPASIGGDFLVQVTFWDTHERSYLTAPWCFGANFLHPKRDCKGIYDGSHSVQMKMWKMRGMQRINVVPAVANKWLAPHPVWSDSPLTKKMGNYIVLDSRAYMYP